MTDSPNLHRRHTPPELEYLCVDNFMQDMVAARALATAFELKLIDYVHDQGGVPRDALQQHLGGPVQGLNFLLDLLIANRVVQERNGNLSLTQPFLKALEYRDLLEVKLEFANWVSHDVVDYFTDLIYRPTRFAQNARILKLFDYHHCFDDTPRNYELTRRWMRITTTLTRYESQVCLAHYDFRPHRMLLDVGGNSGEFLLQICKRFPDLQGTVFDLPLVCDIGRDHVSACSEAAIISFVRGDIRTDNLPMGFDIVTFKSMLHDWPEEQARQILSKAAQTLQPGGKLLIFERGPFELNGKIPPYSLLPFVLFIHSFRPPSVYQYYLEKLGFRDIDIQKIELEMPFYLIVANKA